MKVNIISEHGAEEALLGLGLSYHELPDFDEFIKSEAFKKMQDVADKLYGKGRGHNKFLESMDLWIDVSAPRYFWQQFDTYRIGVTKQSASSMHTITKRELTQDDFEKPISEKTLEHLNIMISFKDFENIKNELPEGFLQRRIIKTDYKTLRNIIDQRYGHKIKLWKQFAHEIYAQCRFPNFLADLIKEGGHAE
jgi:hypothetical protein